MSGLCRCSRILYLFSSRALPQKWCINANILRWYMLIWSLCLGHRRAKPKPSQRARPRSALLCSHHSVNPSSDLRIRGIEGSRFCTQLMFHGHQTINRANLKGSQRWGAVVQSHTPRSRGLVDFFFFLVIKWLNRNAFKWVCLLTVPMQTVV